MAASSCSAPRARPPGAGPLHLHRRVSRSRAAAAAGVPGIGSTLNGARSGFGSVPISFQPSEFAKILLLIFLAGYLVRSGGALLVTHSSWGSRCPGPGPRPGVAAWAASLTVLIVEKDLGSSLLFFGMFLVVLYVATERASWLIIGMLLFVAGAYARTSSSGTCRNASTSGCTPSRATGR